MLFVVLTPQPPPGYCAIIHVDHSTAVVLMFSRRQLSSPLHNQNDKNIHFLQQSICISFYFHILYMLLLLSNPKDKFEFSLKEKGL